MSYKNPARLAALEAGLMYYDSGERCHKGHVSLRYVSNTQCIRCKSTKALPNLDRLRWQEPTPELTEPGMRGVITDAYPDEGRWRVRCEPGDGKIFTVKIGDVDWQQENLPLMIVGAIVEFGLVDGEFPENVRVVSE